MLLLDQRGTGRSSRLDPGVITALGSPQQQADHLALFRADSIVQDCEAIRRALLGDEPWTVLGSVVRRVLHLHLPVLRPGRAARVPGHRRHPAARHRIDDVYRSTYAAVRRRMDDLDRAYPLTRTRLREVADHLATTDELLPSGEPLTVAAAAGGRPRPRRPGRAAAAALPGRGRVGRRPAERVVPARRAGDHRRLPDAVRSTPCSTRRATATPASRSRWSAERVRPEFAWVDAPDGPARADR